MHAERPYDSASWDTLRLRWGAGRVDRSGLPPRYRCPCCTYPTLNARNGCEICLLCWWEDDGQDDPHAAEVWGGPNGGYALADARRNFGVRLVMYAADGDRASEQQDEVVLALKRALMTAFDAAVVGEGTGAPDWTRVAELEASLEAAILRTTAPQTGADLDAP